MASCGAACRIHNSQSSSKGSHRLTSHPTVTSARLPGGTACLTVAGRTGPHDGVIGMVGLIDDTRRMITQGFKTEGDVIALLGVTNDDLSVSESARTIAFDVFDFTVPFYEGFDDRIYENVTMTATNEQASTI